MSQDAKNESQPGPDPAPPAGLDGAVDDLAKAGKAMRAASGGEVDAIGTKARSGLSPAVRAIAVDVDIVLGRVRVSVAELLALREGRALRLDSRVGDPLAIVVNGQTVAYGILADDDGGSVRITSVVGDDLTDIVKPEKRVA